MRKLNVLIAGSTGYIGIQLVKLLVNHKNIKIKFLCGSSSVGKNIEYFDKSLKNKKLPKIVKFNKKFLKHVDIIFTALPNGQAQSLSNLLNKNNILIDLSADFRLKNKNIYKKNYNKNHNAKNLINKSIYSISELISKEIKNFRNRLMIHSPPKSRVKFFIIYFLIIKII